MMELLSKLVEMVLIAQELLERQQAALQASIQTLVALTIQSTSMRSLVSQMTQAQAVRLASTALRPPMTTRLAATQVPTQAHLVQRTRMTVLTVQVAPSVALAHRIHQVLAIMVLTAH